MPEGLMGGIINLSGTQQWTKSLAVSMNHLKRQWIKNMANMAKEGEKSLKPSKLFGKLAKKMEKSKVAKGFAAMAKGIDAVGHVVMDSIGVFMQLAEKMGILQPLMDIIGGVFSIIGGAAMGEMGDALADFAEIMFSPEMMEIWTMLGETIGEFLSILLTNITDLLGDPEFRKVMKQFAAVLTHIFTVIGMVLGTFFKLLGDMSASQLGRLFFTMGVFFAFMKGMAHGGYAGAALGAVYAGIVAVALAPLLAMQHGGYIPATPGGVIVNVGEGGEGEFIVPESKMGMENEEVLWATEDNGKKLDRLIGAIETSNRIKRLKYL